MKLVKTILILLLLCIELSAQDAINKESVFKHFWENHLLSTWQLGVASQAGLIYSEEGKLLKIGLESMVTMDSRSSFDRFRMWSSISYMDEFNSWGDYEETVIHSSTNLEYFKRLSSNLSVGSQVIFEAARFNKKYFGPEANAFIGIKPAIEINLLPIEYADEVGVNLISGIGPHLAFQSQDIIYKYFNSVELQAYCNLNNGLVFLNGAYYHNFEGLTEARLEVDSGFVFEVYKGVSVHMGGGVIYCDGAFSNNAYVLDLPDKGYNEHSPVNYNCYAGLNYKLGVKSWKNFNTGF